MNGVDRRRTIARQYVPAFALAAAAVTVIAARPAGKSAPPSSRPAASLPMLGTKLSELPEGAGKAVVGKGCLQCHSADMLRQQRLTEKQWTSEIDKMIRWGAAVTEDEKPDALRYLVAHFGPENDAFQPVPVAPLSRR